MPSGNVEPESSPDTEDSEAIQEQTGDHSGKKWETIIVKRRQRTGRGHCTLRARERSPTPDAKEAIVMYNKVASVVKLTRKKQVINIKDTDENKRNELPGGGSKETLPRNVSSEKQLTEVLAQWGLESNENKADTASELEDDAEWKEAWDNPGEIVAHPDPRFVPKNLAFYMHDTGRTKTIGQRTPFAKDEKEDEFTPFLNFHSFEPTGDGKWKHDLYEKICDKTKRHSREDHFGRSYGFSKLQFRSGSKPTATYRKNNEVLCWDWLEGLCKYGKSCKFFHAEAERKSDEWDELHGMALNLGVCLDLKQGRCHRGSKCPFSHTGNDGDEPNVCRYWQKGRCRRGSKCKYSHEANFVKIGASSRNLKQRREMVCYYWQNGTCSRGKSCPFLHEYPKRKSSSYSSAKFYHEKMRDKFKPFNRGRR